MGSTQSKGTVGSRFITIPASVASPGPYPNGPNGSKSWRTYDYIIVGGGSAGCVLAARLSEDPNITVFLVEAGKSTPGDRSTSIPFAFPNLFGTEKDWDWSTTPQQHLNGRQTHWHGGRVLGGTSAINASVYTRCTPEDLDEWVSLGAEGWSYSELHPYFMKAENFLGGNKVRSIDAAAHGLHGPWQTSFPQSTAAIDDYIIEACQEIGMRYIDDVNTTRGSLGVTRLVGNIDANGRRSSTASAYLSDNVLRRPNLTIGIGMMVEQILFSNANINMPEEQPRAIGVQLSTGPNSAKYCAAAAQDVILCGGAVGTPQLLLLSGLGPADDLRKLNISVVKDLPHVGRNLIDHVSTGPLPFRVKAGLTYDFLNKGLYGALSLLKWIVFGTGPLSSMGFSSTAFVRATDTKLPYRGPGNSEAPINDRTFNPAVPDLQLVWFPLTVSDTNSQKSAGSNAVTLSAWSLKPESRGSITLRSGSVWVPPVIDPNYLSTESDVNVLVRGVRLLLRIAHTEPLVSQLAANSPLWSSNADPDKISDGEIRGVLRRLASPAWNPVSSARMGRSSADSVVDPNLRVHDVAGLRVVDASVFPTQIAGQPCALVVAMAEKAADMMKASLQR